MPFEAAALMEKETEEDLRDGDYAITGDT